MGPLLPLQGKKKEKDKGWKAESKENGRKERREGGIRRRRGKPRHWPSVAFRNCPGVWVPFQFGNRRFAMLTGACTSLQAVSLNDWPRRPSLRAQPTHSPHPRPGGRRPRTKSVHFPVPLRPEGHWARNRHHQQALFQGQNEKRNPRPLCSLHRVLWNQGRHPGERQRPGRRRESCVAQRGHRVTVHQGARRRSLGSPGLAVEVARREPRSPLHLRCCSCLLPSGSRRWCLRRPRDRWGCGDTSGPSRTGWRVPRTRLSMWGPCSLGSRCQRGAGQCHPRYKCKLVSVLGEKGE